MEPKETTTRNSTPPDSLERVVLILGSNQGDRAACISRALALLTTIGQEEQRSRVYESDPWGSSTRWLPTGPPSPPLTSWAAGRRSSANSEASATRPSVTSPAPSTSTSSFTVHGSSSIPTSSSLIPSSPADDSPSFHSRNYSPRSSIPFSGKQSLHYWKSAPTTGASPA